MENNMPGAEEFFKKVTGCVINHKDVKIAMIEFAKLHVEAALKAAHKNMQLPPEDLEFTLNAYPLTNIK
jgi:hypothetical protein